MKNRKPVEGYEGRYSVTDDGRVVGPRGRPLVPHINRKTGYSQLVLRINGKASLALVHRLVAEAFIPNPYGKPTVNHKNGDKTDNRAENLEWATRSENMRHAYREHLAPTVPVTAVSKEGTAREFDSISEAARFCGATHIGGIWNALRGKAKTAYGYHWQYADPKRRTR